MFWGDPWNPGRWLGLMFWGDPLEPPASAGVCCTGAGLRLAGLVMAGANSGPRLFGRRDR